MVTQSLLNVDPGHGVTIGFNIGNNNTLYAYWSNLFADLNSLGCTWIRLNYSWKNIERTQGNYTWTVLDDAVAHINASTGPNGKPFKLLYCLRGAPTWALVNTAQKGSSQPQYLPDPTLMAGFASAVVSRYNGGAQGHIDAIGYNEDFNIDFTSSTDTLTLNQNITNAGGPYTSVTINAAANSADPGTLIYFGGYSNTTDVATVSSAVSVGDTTVHISSFTPAVTYSSGTAAKVAYIRGANNSPYDLYNPGPLGVRTGLKSQPARDGYYAAQVMLAVTPAVRALNPTLPIGTPCIWWLQPSNTPTFPSGLSNMTAYLTQIYTTAGSVIDAYTFLDGHYYSNAVDPTVGSGQTSTIAQYVADVQNVSASFSDSGRQLWLTEFGWQIPNDVSTEAQQSTNYSTVLNAVIPGANPQKNKIFFFTLWYDPSSSINSSLVYWNGTGYSRRQAYSTLQLYIAAHPSINDSYGTTILADAPQAYYRLNETTGTVAYDSSGNGHAATVTGATLSQPGGLTASGDTDTCMYFTASGGLQLPYTLNYTTFSALSLEFLINVASTWNHIVVTCNGPTTTVYLNGAASTPQPGSSLEIGAIFEWAGSYVAGYLDEVSIYNYALSPTQVHAHYTAAFPASSSTPPPSTPPPPPIILNAALTMSGVDITPYIQEETIKIKDTMGQGQGMASGGSSNSRAATCEFLCSLGPAASAVGAGTHISSPQLVRQGEVLVYDYTGTAIFGGFVGKLTDQTSKKSVFTKVEAYDYWQELARFQVQKTYSGKTDIFMIKDLLTSYAPWVDQSALPGSGTYTFTAKNFKATTLQQALGQIADVTGYNMWITPDKKIHYVFPTNGATAPFRLSDTPDNSLSFPFGWDNSAPYVVDDTATINRATFYGGKQPSNSFQQDLSTQANGSNRTFVLAFYPRSLPNGTITVVSANLNSGNPLTVGYLLGRGTANEFVSSGGTANVLLNADAHTLFFDPGAAAPTNTGANSVYATYRYEFPMIVQLTSQTSFQKFGKYFDGVVSDQTVFDQQTAVGRLRTLLDEQENGLITVKVRCWKAGIQAGMLLNIYSTVRGINASFMVQEVDVVPLGAGLYAYDITAGAWNWNLVDVLLSASHAAFNAGINVNDTTNGQDIAVVQIKQDIENIKFSAETWTTNKTRTWGGYYARTTALNDGHDAYAGLFSVSS